MKYWLWITSDLTGVTTLMTFSAADERGYAAITWAAQAVTIRLQDVA